MSLILIIMSLHSLRMDHIDMMAEMTNTSSLKYGHEDYIKT